MPAKRPVACQVPKTWISTKVMQCVCSPLLVLVGSKWLPFLVTAWPILHVFAVGEGFGGHFISSLQYCLHVMYFFVCNTFSKLQCTVVKIEKKLTLAFSLPTH